MKNKLVLLSLVSSLLMVTGCSMNFDIPENSSESGNAQSSSQSSSSSESSEESSSEDEEQYETTEYNTESSSATATKIKNMINSNGKSSNTSTLYRITGTAQWATDGSFGNFDIVDDTGYIYVYGCSKNKSSIVKNSGYSFSNDYSFSSMSIKPGDQVTIEGIYVWYEQSSTYGVSEFQGYVTKVVRKNASQVIARYYNEDEPAATSAVNSYYSSISSSDSGSALETKLHNLMDTTHTNYISYNSLASHYTTTDKYGSSGIKCFYSGERADSTSWNREHVWAQSLSGASSKTQLYGTEYGGADLLHVRPAIKTYNELRSNATFGTVFGNKDVMKYINYKDGGTNYCTGNVFEPADEIKGDVARIIMYMYIHYSNDFSGGNSKSYYGTMQLSRIMGPSGQDAKKLLRRWNALDPVSEEEIARNNYAFSVQKNRNPFIDHPKLADKMWA